MKKFVFAFPSKNKSVTVATLLSLQALEKAILHGNMICKKLNNNETHIIEKKRLTTDEIYRIHLCLFRHMLKQSDSIVGIIQKIVQPLIRNNIYKDKEIQQQGDKIMYLERQVIIFQDMSNMMYDKTMKEKLPKNRMQWNGQIKDAAVIIIRTFEYDCKNDKKLYRSLRETSDVFFDSHDFKNKPKPDFTKEMLYMNVKKVHSQ